METIEGIPVGATLGADWEAVLSKWRREQRLCVRCGLPYKELENIGRWKCSQHAWSQPDGDTRKFTCCGKPWRDTPGAVKACVPADHCSLPDCREWSTEHDLFLPNDLIPTLGGVGILKASVRDGTERWEAQGFDPNNPVDIAGTTVIRRYDWQRAQTLCATTRPPSWEASQEATFYHSS